MVGGGYLVSSNKFRALREEMEGTWLTKKQLVRLNWCKLSRGGGIYYEEEGRLECFHCS